MSEDELDERRQAAETLDALTEGPPGFAETADDLEPLPAGSSGAFAETADELEPLDPDEPPPLALVLLIVVLSLIVVGGLIGIALLSR